MSEDATLYLCKACGGLYPRGDFEGVKRRGRVCVRCREKRKYGGKRDRGWDYVAALHKSTKLRISKSTCDHRNRLGASFDDNALRALFRAQDNRCALTTLQFLLPSVEDLVKVSGSGTGNHVALDSWAKACENDPRKLARLPELVRKCDLAPWVPGNVMLVCRGISGYFDFCKLNNMSVTEMSEAIIGINQRVVVPSQDEVLKHILAIRKEEEEGKFI